MSVRFGLIGYGGIGRVHAQAVQESGNAELGRVCTGSDASAQRAAAELKIPAGTDPREVLEDPGIDVIIIASPNHLHAGTARQALAAGKDVLLEKPMALTLAECDAIRSEAAAHDRILFVDHELRYSPLWCRVADAVTGGLIGEPLSATLNLWRAPYRQGNAGWRYDPARVGNWIYEEPIHFFDILRWLLQRDPGRVTSAGVAASDKGSGLVSSFASLFDFGDGRFGAFQQTLTGFGHHIECDLVGRDGAIRARWSGADGRSEQPQISLVHWDGATAQPIDIPSTPGEAYEIGVQLEDLIGAVRRRDLTTESAHRGAWAVAMCDAATTALQIGDPVVIPAPAEGKSIA